MDPISKNVKLELDHISSLPEPIRSKIIEHLPVEELVRTSVLSKRWQHTWKYAENLDFDVTKMTSDCGRLLLQVRRRRKTSDFKVAMLEEDLCMAAKLVRTILGSHLGTVKSCRISQFPKGIPDMIKAVECLIQEKALQELYLAGLCLGHNAFQKEKDFRLPSWGKTLRVLELHKCLLGNDSTFEECENLHTLRLTSIQLRENYLEQILAYCKSLTELSLCSCKGVPDLKIHDENLKMLEIRSMFFDKINIQVESLNVLILEGICCPPSSIFIKAPTVVEFELYRPTIGGYIEMEEILSHSCGILDSSNNADYSSWTETCYISPFKKLQMFSASLDLNNIREAIILSYLFQECSNLQTLRICSPVDEGARVSGETGNHMSYPDHLFWDRKETYESIAKNLSMVWIRRFGGFDLEMEFAKYIITRAPKMKRLIIECNGNCTTYVTSLLNLPKVSMDLSIMLKHPRLPNENYGREISYLSGIEWGHFRRTL